MSGDWLRGCVDGVLIQVLVQPRAARNEVVGVQGEELKIRLTSPPVEGAANRLCCDYLAGLCGVPRSCVTLLAGQRSRHKRLHVQGLDLAGARKILAPGPGND
jgi:uncharacterized protein (TIGR00251 family)